MDSWDANRLYIILHYVKSAFLKKEKESWSKQGNKNGESTGNLPKTVVQNLMICQVLVGWVRWYHIGSNSTWNEGACPRVGIFEVISHDLNWFERLGAGRLLFEYSS